MVGMRSGEGPKMVGGLMMCCVVLGGFLSENSHVAITCWDYRRWV